MSIEKFNNEKTVTIETSKVDNQPNNLSDFLPKQKTAHFYKISNYFFALIIFVTILSVAKIPYCGSYLDAYIFEFLIGTYIKFLAYLFILLFCVAKIFSKWKFCQFITSKRSIIGWICILIAAILINTIIYEFTNANGTGTLSFNSFLHIGSLVKDYVNRFNLIVDKYINKFTPFVWPINSALVGIIGCFIFDLWGLIVTIFTIALLFLLIMIAILCISNQTNNRYIKKFKHWVVKHLTHNEMIDKMTSELAGSSDDVKPNIVQKYEIKQEALQTSSQTPPLSFLSETSVDNFLSCKIEAKEYADIITNFLRKFDSIVHFQKTIVTPLYCEISYDIEKQTIINDIFANQNKVLEELNIKTFNLLYKNNTVRFEILNKTPSKVSLKSALTMLGDIKPNRYIIGIDENSNTVAIDINDKPNTVLIGTKGSGVSMLLTVMIVSLAYTNNPKNLGIMVLSPNNDKSLKILSQLPHFIEPIKYEQLDVSKSLMDLRVEIAKRETLLSKSKSRTIEEHNRRSPSEIDHLKRIVVIILNFNIISRISVENHELLTDLLKKGADVGISTILKTNSVDQQLLDKGIYKNLDAKLVMKLEFEQESIQLLDSRRGVELFGNGDGYYFDTKEKKNIRFQSCYMNIKELEQTIKIIETFYSIKSKII